jgi:hypothetical protein
MTFEEIEDCFPDGALSDDETGNTLVSAQWLHDFAKNIAAHERTACAECVPSNWLDPILTGKYAAIGGVADCGPIEAVLRATKTRIMGRSNAELYDKNEIIDGTDGTCN